MNEASEKMVKAAVERANQGSSKIIIGDDKKRADLCAQAIGKAIKQLEQQFDCIFMPCMQITPDGNMGSFFVRPKPRRGGSNNGGSG